MRKLLLIFFSIIFLTICVRWHCTSYAINQHFSLATDQCISPEMHTLITDELTCLLKENNSLSTCISHLQKKIPLIESVSIALQPLRNLVSLRLYKPLCIVNDTAVLANNNALFPLSFFLSAQLKKVPTICATQEYLDNNIHSLSQSLAQLPKQVLKTYHLEYTNKNHMKLIEKNNAPFSIVCTVSQPISTETLTHCEKIKQHILQKNLFNKHKAWVADIRFSDYIVAYKA